MTEKIISDALVFAFKDSLEAELGASLESAFGEFAEDPIERLIALNSLNTLYHSVSFEMSSEGIEEAYSSIKDNAPSFFALLEKKVQKNLSKSRLVFAIWDGLKELIEEEDDKLFDLRRETVALKDALKKLKKQGEM